MSSTRRRLAELRAPDVASRLGAASIVVQPLGAIEQHGPHLPFNTDLVIAGEVAEATIDEYGDELDLWLLPAIAYTKSNEHAWSAGTVWLSATTLFSVLDDIGRCVSALPARKLVFFNGHGGNSALVNVANRELRLRYGLMTFLAHPGQPVDQGGAGSANESELGMGVHAGTDETSLMLHLRPELVDMSAATRNVPEWLAANDHVRFGGRVSFGWLSNDFGPAGLIGDPTAATAERGKELFEGAVKAFGQALAEVATFELPRSTAPLPPVRIDRDRLLRRIEALGEIGAIEGLDGSRGSARLALTDADREGRDLVVAWMLDLGLDVTVDGIGNVVATRAGREPDLAPVMTGSHIDTVRTGGRFDGNLGVLAGLEVIETLATTGIRTRRPLAVAFFTNEEGARFQPDMLGSLVLVGGMPLEQALDVAAIDGPGLGTELARIGYAGPYPCPIARPPHAFVELHIEQGPVLESEGCTIGAVTGVQGISWQELSIVGQSNHAGTTPMAMRHDPAYAAAEVATFARRLALELRGHQVATVGRVELFPNLVNVVPAEATLTVDLRNTDDEILRDAERRLRAFCVELAEREGVTIASRVLARFEPVAFDPHVIDLVQTTAERLGHRVMRLPAGAGHDAQMLARICPAGMVFMPSARGISHNPAEYTDAADLEAGANVLLQVILTLAS